MIGRVKSGPYAYELWINGESIFANSVKYLTNVARRKGGDWAIYECYKSKTTASFGNMKLLQDDIVKIVDLWRKGKTVKEISLAFKVTERAIKYNLDSEKILI